MKSFFAALALLATSASVLAAPVETATPPPTDTQILQYALTLEHLENFFYHDALKKFDEAAFEDAGFEFWVRARFQEIADHEAAHVSFLETALGDKAPKPCIYDFPYTDVTSFVTLSAVLEGVGVSAYLGAAHFIENKDYLTAAGAILTTESRHNAWVNSAVNHKNPWSGPLDTPLSLDQVFTLAAGFIKSCPSSANAPPVSKFPGLTFTADSLSEGSTVKLTFDNKDHKKGLQLAFFNGLATSFSPIHKGEAKIPHGLSGTAYAVVTTVSSGAVTDANIIAGPAIFDFGVPISHDDGNGDDDERKM